MRGLFVGLDPGEKLSGPLLRLGQKTDRFPVLTRKLLTDN